MSAAMKMSDSMLQARGAKGKVDFHFPTPSTVASDLDADMLDMPQLDLNAGTKISHYDHAFPVSKVHPEPQTQSHLNLTWDQAFLPSVRVAQDSRPQEKASVAAAWETAFGVPRPRNDILQAFVSANTIATTTWDAAFKAHMPVARFPEMPRHEAMPSWDRAFA